MSLNLFGRRRSKGEILKAERMLVRIERIDNPNQSLPAEYNEGNSVDTRLKREWREYYVVARAPHDEHRHIVLHIHKSRVIPEQPSCILYKCFTISRRLETCLTRIPATMQTHTGKMSRWQIVLDPSNTKVSLFSPLDKTIAIHHPKRDKGFILFILNCQSLQSSTQWYAFIRLALNGPPREKMVLITIPDLDNLQIQVNTYREGPETVDDDGTALLNGHPITAKEIVGRCMDELRKEKRYADVLDYWERRFEMGLCWKRYDRIEWLTGTMKADQDELAGSWPLQHTHSLELRPKTHYPTTVRLGFESHLQEPVPVEGFLIRLTAASGRQARLGKLFYKRLYFTSHDNLLFFCSPAKAAPPPPPKALQLPKADNTEDISTGMPLIWATTPYKLQDGQIQWLKDAKTPREVTWYDEKAKIEHERCVQLVKTANGCIDLVKVKYVRTVKRKPESQDAGIGQGQSVDFHASELSTNDSVYAFEEGVGSEFDDERTFELVLENGLVIRLQSYSLETRKEWMRRLRDLIKYWKLRLQADIDSLKEMRACNLKMTGMDRGNESRFGDWIQRYQLVEAVSAPGMYHFCRISNCRTLSVSPRLRDVIDGRCAGHLLTSRTLIIYELSARSNRGIAQPRIHHKKARQIDLRHCYVYSGQMVDSELRYQSTSLDPHLGYRVLPKVYWDGWTSVDDDLSCAFVVWHGQRKFTFRQQNASKGEEHNIANVGLPGNIAVFVARSRPERDMWVMALEQEINRHASTVGEKLNIY